MLISRNGMDFLHLAQLRFRYPGQTAPVVDGVDWQLPAGALHCLLGRSGCGKSTVLQLAAGLLQAQSGQVRLQGQAVTAPVTALGMMFQAPTLLDWQSALDNVLLPISLQRRPTAQDRAWALQLLEQLGLRSHAGHLPRQLSGGQQSRVALARALVLRPRLLLLDEPFAALDALTRAELQDDLLRTCQQHHTAVLMVTHDIQEAVYLSQRIALMHAGRIVQDVAIALPQPRQPSLRHSSAFHQYCAQLQTALLATTPAPTPAPAPQQEGL